VEESGRDVLRLQLVALNGNRYIECWPVEGTGDRLKQKRRSVSKRTSRNLTGLVRVQVQPVKIPGSRPPANFMTNTGLCMKLGDLPSHMQ
jgi:hypothetical protein